MNTSTYVTENIIKYKLEKKKKSNSCVLEELLSESKQRSFSFNSMIFKKTEIEEDEQINTYSSNFYLNTNRTLKRENEKSDLKSTRYTNFQKLTKPISLKNSFLASINQDKKQVKNEKLCKEISKILKIKNHSQIPKFLTTRIININKSKILPNNNLKKININNNINRSNHSSLNTSRVDPSIKIIKNEKNKKINEIFLPHPNPNDVKKSRNMSMTHIPGIKNLMEKKNEKNESKNMKLIKNVKIEPKIDSKINLKFENKKSRYVNVNPNLKFTAEAVLLKNTCKKLKSSSVDLIHVNKSQTSRNPSANTSITSSIPKYKYPPCPPNLKFQRYKLGRGLVQMSITQSNFNKLLLKTLTCN